MLIFAALLSSCSKIPNTAQDSETEPVLENNENVITIGLIGLMPAAEDEESVSARIHQKILDDFGINIQTITFSEENWKEELDDMIAQGTVPDVFFHDVIDDPLQYRELIDLGLVRDIPKSMWVKRANLAKVLSWYEDIYSVDGKMYFVPRTYQTFDQTHGASYAILYRRDWAYLLSAIPPEDPHYYNVMDMMRLFVSSDPDSNNVKDTWGITGGDDIDFINHAFLEPFGVREWVFEDGKWIPGLLSSKAKEAVAWISQLYKEGVVDPDFTQQTSTDALNKFITGKSGSCLVSIFPEQLKEIEEKWLIYNTDPIEHSVDIMPLYFAPDGYRYNETETFSTGTMFSSKLSDENLEKVLDLFDWLYSVEGRTYMEYGEENKDYSIVFNEITPKSDGEEEIQLFSDKNIEYKPLENLASWNLDFLPDYSGVTEFQSYGISVLQYDIWAFSYPKELFTNGMITPEICVLNIEDVARDMLFEVIMVSSDFDSSWERYVEYCYDTFNVEEAGEEVAQRATELGITP